MIISDLFHGCYHYLLPPPKWGAYSADIAGTEPCRRKNPAFRLEERALDARVVLGQYRSSAGVVRELQ